MILRRVIISSDVSNISGLASFSRYPAVRSPRQVVYNKKRWVEAREDKIGCGT
jgi:hypothetical protein